MHSHNLSSDAKLTMLKAITTASATGAINSDILDMAGYRGVLFLANVGTANSSISLKAQAGTATGSLNDVTNSSVPCLSTGGNIWLDLCDFGSSFRYVRAVLTREAATKAGNIWGIQYGARYKPVDNTIADTITGELIVGVSSGTA